MSELKESLKRSIHTRIDSLNAEERSLNTELKYERGVVNNGHAQAYARKESRDNVERIQTKLDKILMQKIELAKELDLLV